MDHVGVQVISAADPQWIFPFAGLNPTQFRRLVRLVAQRGGDRIADGRPGRPWALPLPDRVLLVAAYWRTNLTLRQIAPAVRGLLLGRLPGDRHDRSVRCWPWPR
ncbi:hypothetical protein Franean1_3116 [Parafrankia sp. EAN1pec]|nr:hypothetical protein Franean1_3116 [Frankia sp. EAN1pec]